VVLGRGDWIRPVCGGLGGGQARMRSKELRRQEEHLTQEEKRRRNRSPRGGREGSKVWATERADGRRGGSRDGHWPRTPWGSEKCRSNLSAPNQGLLKTAQPPNQALGDYLVIYFCPAGDQAKGLGVLGNCSITELCPQPWRTFSDVKIALNITLRQNIKPIAK
jgi:hypothetical protein